MNAKRDSRQTTKELFRLLSPKDKKALRAARLRGAPKGVTKIKGSNRWNPRPGIYSWIKKNLDTLGNKEKLGLILNRK